MFWKRNEGEPSEERPVEETRAEPSGAIRIERDAQRPAAILRVAGEFEERGARILELFKEVQTPHDQAAVIPIHLSQDDEEFFVEVSTRPWSGESIEAALHMAAVVRGSEYADKGLEVLSAYPVPGEVEFFFGRSPAALFQLDLLRGSLERPEEFAEIFRETARHHWDIDLAYERDGLPLVEELLTAALNSRDEHASLPPILNALVDGLGCFVGEVIQRNTQRSDSWNTATEWGDGLVLEFDEAALDPIGKARAFLHEGQEDSVAFYADYVIRELDDAAALNEEASS
jgi:hypothetical protein